MDPGGTSVVATGSPRRVMRSIRDCLSTAMAKARRTPAWAKGLIRPSASRGLQLKLKKSVPKASSTCRSWRSPRRACSNMSPRYSTSVSVSQSSDPFSNASTAVLASSMGRISTVPNATP